MSVPFLICVNATVTEFPMIFVIPVITGFVPLIVTFRDASEKTSPAGLCATIEMLYAVVSFNPLMVIDDASDEDASTLTEEPSNE